MKSVPGEIKPVFVEKQYCWKVLNFYYKERRNANMELLLGELNGSLGGTGDSAMVVDYEGVWLKITRMWLLVTGMWLKIARV
jgi:hypothetical protein